MRLLTFFRLFFIAVAIGAAGVLMVQSNEAQPISSKPIYVPNISRESDALADSTMAWDATMKATNVPADAENAHFVFYFTNVAVGATGPIPVTILDVHPSCGCTTAQLPSLPWTIQPGGHGQIGVTVNLAGKYGTLVKTVHVGTDQGSRDLILQITIEPPVVPVLTDAERIRQMAIAKADRQAVFKGDCVICHVNQGDDKYGRPLYDADCGICHEAKHRASMVPDLHDLKVPTNDAFWRTWIAHGKPGTFMPAFSTADGGPLDDMQIASLAAYLDAMIPSKVPQPQ